MHEKSGYAVKRYFCSHHNDQFMYRKIIGINVSHNSTGLPSWAGQVCPESE
jgi:hypothetical protein